MVTYMWWCGLIQQPIHLTEHGSAALELLAIAGILGMLGSARGGAGSWVMLELSKGRSGVDTSIGATLCTGPGNAGRGVGAMLELSGGWNVAGVSLGDALAIEHGSAKGGMGVFADEQFVWLMALEGAAVILGKEGKDNCLPSGRVRSAFRDPECRIPCCEEISGFVELRTSVRTRDGKDSDEQPAVFAEDKFG